MHTHRIRLGAEVAALFLFGLPVAQAGNAEAVSFPSSNTTIHGLLYKPAGNGPFPTVVYYGNFPGDPSDPSDLPSTPVSFPVEPVSFETVAVQFTSQGWAFFALYRRAPRGMTRGESRSDALEDQIEWYKTSAHDDRAAALAWLQRQSFVRPHQISVMGNARGGIEAVLEARNDSYCAVVDAGGAAFFWDYQPMQQLLLDAVKSSRAPILFIQATNDLTLESSQVLYDAMLSVGKSPALHFYPAFGASPADAHSFLWQEPQIWSEDVVGFLNTSCR
jgi:dienelactone hydrolase